MLGQPAVASYQLGRFYAEKVSGRKSSIAKTVHDCCKIVQDILKEVESQEPRFISTLVENQARFEGVNVVAPHEFEVVLYLNQMGVFNFVDDGSVPGCAVLKLSDGRKRSMSLWVEFITASGYLSARKIRSRFQTLVAQAVDKTQYRDCVKMISDTSEVRLRIQEKFVVQITCAFRCNGIWPRSASQWPQPQINWPGPNMVSDVKTEGFDLFSRESIPSHAKQNSSSMEGDAWAMSFTGAEDILLSHGCRRRCLSVLKTLRDQQLEFPGGGSPITAYLLKTLLLFECEKHPHEHEWDELAVSDRIVGILIQLVSCLQCRRCPHYFINTVDLLRGKPPQLLEQAAKQTWRLVRELITNVRALEQL